MEYSAYELTGDNTWVGIHRLPLNIAIRYCVELRGRHFNKVALVPDGSDPMPYFRLAIGLPHYGAANPDAEIVRIDETVNASGIPYPRGRCDTCGAPCDDKTGACTENTLHIVAIA